jgi:hypothetical protein
MSAPPLEIVLDAIGEYKQTGSEFQARCPAHEDANTSLSIRATTDGTVLLKCHAGCGTANVLETLGLSMRDLFPRLAREERKDGAA